MFLVLAQILDGRCSSFTFREEVLDIADLEATLLDLIQHVQHMRLEDLTGAGQPMLLEHGLYGLVTPQRKF